MTLHTVFLITFVIWSFPLGAIRYRFRKMAYATDSWWINIKPVFWKEIKVLFGSHTIHSEQDLQLITYYRFYLLIYFALLAGIVFF